MKKIEKQYRNRETIQKQRNNIEIEKRYRNLEKKRLMVCSEVTITTGLYLKNQQKFRFLLS